MARSETRLEPREYVGFVRRTLRSLTRRVIASGDWANLAVLVELHEQVDAALVEAIGAMRTEYGYSWAEVGRGLGVTRQTAHERYAHRIAERQPA